MQHQRNHFDDLIMKAIKKLLGLTGKLVGIILIASALMTWLSYDYPNYSAYSPRALFPNIFEQIGLFVNWILVVVQATIGVYAWKVEDYLDA